MAVECLESRPHEAVSLPALHSYFQENIHRLGATRHSPHPLGPESSRLAAVGSAAHAFGPPCLGRSLTWQHDIKAACDIELAK